MKQILELKELAYRAHSGTSFSPERRAEQFVNEFSDDLTNFLESIPEDSHTWATEKYVSLLRNWLHAKSRCVSSMIAGPANFPVRRMQKYNNWERGHYDVFSEWRKNTIKRLNRKEKPTLDQELFNTENLIHDLELTQEMMKEGNKVMRSSDSDEEKREDLENMGFSEKLIHECFKPHYSGRVGFPPFMLTNNLATIKHHKEKLLKIQIRINARSVEKKETVIEGVKIVENVEADRLQIFFDGKPEEPVRNSLKKNGFKWSPSNGCWQTYLASGKYKVSSLQLVA